MLKVENVRSWRDLLECLNNFSPEQLDQPVQVCGTHPVESYVHELQPAYCVGTVEELGILYCRSSVDNRKNNKEVILCVDYNPFAVDGAIAHQWGTYDDEKDVFIKQNIPIYPKDYTEDQNWTGPAQKVVNAEDTKDQEFTPQQLLILKHRIEKHD